MDEDSTKVPSVLETRGDFLTSIWFVVGMLCALISALFISLGVLKAPIPEHEQLQPIFLALFTLFLAGTILGLVRTIFGGVGVIIVFLVVLLFSLTLAIELAIWGAATMPSVLRPFNIYDWILLFAFSVFVLIGHRRFIPDQ
jgi:hypothetical protein